MAGGGAGVRQVAIAAGLVAILSGAALVTRNVVATRLQAARNEAATVVRGLTAVDTATATAGLSRALAQRAAIDSMRSTLARLVALESASLADTGFYQVNFGTALPAHGNIGPFITIAFDGWLAWISNPHSDVWCAVAVGPDTQWIGRAPSGKPACFGASVPTPDFARIGEADHQRYLRAYGQPR